MKIFSRSLAPKLMLAFVAVSLTVAILAAVIIRYVTLQEFEDLVINNAQKEFISQVTTYYQARGSWQGVGRFIREQRESPQNPPPRNAQGNPQGLNQNQPNFVPRALVFALADQGGVIVVPVGIYRMGEVVSDDILQEGFPLEADGEWIGTVLTIGEPPPLDPREESYLERTNRSLIYAGLGATGIAVVLGIFLTRGLTKPLQELKSAIYSMSDGELGLQVPVRSQDEIGELTAAFNKMSADLARLIEQRKQMTADIAHDLRTPLTVLGGYLEAMQDDILKPTPERLETMRTEIQGLIRLVEDLRTLSLADAGELTLNRVMVAPQALTDRLANLFQHRAEKHGVQLNTDTPLSIPNVFIDPDRMIQVLGNLVGNALRYTPEGGVVSIQCSVVSDWESGFGDQLQIRERSITDNGLLITVKDTGKGIPPNTLPNIFDRFYRGDEARQQESSESGLGLAIAKSIVEAHGGTITAESDGVNKGSTFRIFLPGNCG